MRGEGRKAKLLFVHTTLSSFVRTDLEILERHFDVRRLSVTTFLIPRRGKNPIEFLRLLKGILWADINFTWFADVNAFFITLFSMILHKKSIIVVGGYDVAYVPEIGYGDLGSSRNRVRIRFTLEHASKILPFSYYAQENVLRITSKADLQVIQLVCDTKKFKPFHGKKEDVVVTVCNVDKGNIKRKGLETFVKSGRFLPQTKFALIGRHVDNSANYLKGISTPNVEFTGSVSDEELYGWYQKARTYCQLSYEEGFGVALVEAMACECIPVVSSKARVLKETVADCGYYVPYGDVETTVEAIRKALAAPQELREKARNRAKELFSIERREKKLLSSINNIMGARK